jgi:hypothetical protein
MRSLSRRLSSAIADDLCIWTFAAELYARAYAGVVSLRREESGPEFLAERRRARGSGKFELHPYATLHPSD